jgi:hypothetical protein
MGSLRRTPVRRNLRKFAHHQRLDVRLAGLFIVEVSADIADMRIGQTNDLTGVTGVGENFLISGKAGIENDFAAPARDGARRTAIKYAPVLERQSCGTMQNFGQCTLR